MHVVRHLWDAKVQGLRVSVNEICVRIHFF